MSKDTYLEYMIEDTFKIQVRARHIYYRKSRILPWEMAPGAVQEEFEERAARELWDENALNFEPKEAA